MDYPKMKGNYFQKKLFQESYNREIKMSIFNFKGWEGENRSGKTENKIYK